MSNVDLARFQFARTSINHFFFVPVTIGLAFLTALLQTAWYRNGNPELAAADPVLRHAAGDQRRGRRGDRAGAGVRVRHELVGVLAASSATSSAPRWRWRGWRRSSWSRRSWACGSSAGTSCRAGCIWPRSGWWPPAACCRRRSSWRPTRGCSTRSATRSTGGGPQLTNIWAVFTNPVFLWGYVHGRPGVAHHRRAGHAGGVGLAAAQGHGPGDLRPLGCGCR